MTFLPNNVSTMSEKIDLENAYWKEEKKFKLENMIDVLVSMKNYKIHKINQPDDTANVIRKERIQGESLIF